MSGGRLRVVILTCSALGFESARALLHEPLLEVVGILRAREPRPRGVRRRLARALRERGAWGVAKAVAGAVGRRLAGEAPAEAAPVPCVEVDDFHSAAGLAALRAMRPDVAVVDGTGILRPEVFGLPPRGSVNIHCGYLPEYRGAPPAFWELYNGDSTTGVSIHRVAAAVDTGPILARTRLALPEMPCGADPLALARHFWMTVQRPVAMLLLREALRLEAEGRSVEVPQGAGQGRTFRTPSRREVKALQERCRARARDA